MERLKMKKIYLLLLVALCATACDNSNGPSIERRYYENSEISLSQENSGAYVSWETGEKTAIVFSYFHEEDENISDDELTELLYVELPADLTEFSISTDSDLPETEIEVYYVRSCFCYFEQPYTFLRKNISGQKIAQNQWRISFDVVVELNGEEYPLKDSGVYVLSTFEN